MLFAFGAKILAGIGFGDQVAKRFAWVPLVILALVALGAAALIVIKVATNWFDTTIDTAKDAGASEQIIRGQDQTLGQLGDANDAEKNLNSGGERNATRYAECLLDAREPANCERYNPDAGE